MNHNHGLTRRHALKTALAIAASPWLGASSSLPQASRTPDIASAEPAPRFAVSLHQSVATLANGDADDPGGTEASRPYGLTRVDGYVIDRARSEIVLWGQREQSAPTLDISDLIVALRVAHGLYGIREGNVIKITEPGVSIDPIPAVIHRLDALLDRMPHDMDARAAAKRQWAELCATPQTVRIDGMPVCRAAKCLIEVDYRMKQVSQGIVTLPVDPPFSSLDAAHQQMARERLVGDQPMPASSSYNRFWFEPGHFSHQYSADGDVVFIDRAQIVLRDEQESLHASGVLRASGHVDPLARAFAEAWTRRMEEIERSEPIWRDMHNVFRHFAIARIIADRGVFREAGLDADFVLNRCELPPIAIPASLPGLGRIEELSCREKQGNQIRIRLLLSTVCGGVSVGFGRRLDAQPDVGGKVAACGSRVLGCRPDPMATSWPVPA